MRRHYSAQLSSLFYTGGDRNTEFKGVIQNYICKQQWLTFELRKLNSRGRVFKLMVIYLVFNYLQLKAKS